MPELYEAPTLDDALAVLGALAEGYEARGEKTLIFCEDRLTLLAERAVLERVGGTMLTEVTTFARFLSRSRTGTRILSKQGSVMAISAILSARQSELKYSRRGAAQAVYETLAQLSASRVDEELLLRGADETDGNLRGKLTDLALLLAAYRDFLREEGCTDESGALSLLPEAIARAGLAQTNVVFFAFSSFTRQAREGIEAALDAAKSVRGIFFSGEESLYTHAAANAFRRALRERGAEARSERVEPTLNEDAAWLLGGLFTPERLTGEEKPTARVRRFTMIDEEAEFTAVAALIRRHAAEDGLRWRDFAVLVRGEESFPLVKRVFSAYHIPFFADEQRPLSEHPFSGFVLNVLAAAADRALPSEADAVASSVYFGEGDEYRNYLLKYGNYRGAVYRAVKEGAAVKDYDREALCACAERMRAILALFPPRADGAGFSRSVRSLMELVDAARVTEELRAGFAGAERTFLELAPLEEVLDEIASVARDPMPVREFASLLKSGLEAKKVSMIPQSADAVFVGDATESRFARVKVLFATGLDGLPRTSQDTAVISDGEIARLADLEVVIEPAIAEVNARAREGLGLNLCSFSERLYLSCPMRRGRDDCEKGEILRSAEKLFSMPAMPDLFPYDGCERMPAVRGMLARRTLRTERDEKRFAGLAAFLRERGEPVDRLLGGEEKPRVDCRQLYSFGKVSPTLLERYFECPYKSFAERGLRLAERDEVSVKAVDTGTFMHAVLEEVARRIPELPDEDACRALARETGEQQLKTPRFAGLADTEAGSYTGERLIAEGQDVAAALYRQVVLSEFTVSKTEAVVKVPELALEGKTDRIDTSGPYVRIIDYKTGAIDSDPVAYYTGRKLQLELYLKGASEGGIPAGAFYFPAVSEILPQSGAGTRFLMKGFFNADEEVVRRMDRTLTAGASSGLFDYKMDGKSHDGAMSGEELSAFLDYAVLVAAGAEGEMKRGNIAPSPYEGACKYCKFGALCGFRGEERSENKISCGEIVSIVRRAKGEK